MRIKHCLFLPENKDIFLLLVSHSRITWALAEVEGRLFIVSRGEVLCILIEGQLSFCQHAIHVHPRLAGKQEWQKRQGLICADNLEYISTSDLWGMFKIHIFSQIKEYKSPVTDICWQTVSLLLCLSHAFNMMFILTSAFYLETFSVLAKW